MRAGDADANYARDRLRGEPSVEMDMDGAGTASRRAHRQGHFCLVAVDGTL
jgi:hypothetical protein